VTIYTFPSSLWHIASVQFPLQPLSTSSPQSAFNPFMFTDGPTSEFWQCTATLTPADDRDRRAIDALLRKLRGKRNKIRLYDPSRVRLGAGATGPTVNFAAAAAAGDMTIQLTGFLPNEAIGLAADDVLGVGENLYAVSDDAPTDADGNITLNVLPPMRQGAAIGDPVTLASDDIESITGPTGLFQLVGGADAATVVAGGIRQPLQLQFVEDPDFD